MRYQMKEKMFALGDDFLIKDENGQDVYFVDGKAISFGKKLAFKDMAGRELGRIRQKVFSLGRTYEIDRDGRLAAVVKQALFKLWGDRFSIRMADAGQMTVHGNFFRHDYSIERGGREVARVSKKIFSLTDAYGIDIAPGEDDILLLSTVVVIDLCSHEKD